MTKSSYLEAKNKIKVRDKILSSLPKTVNTVVGLPGPDINEYIDKMSSYGIKRFILYEKDPLVMLHQLSRLKRDCTYLYGDINEFQIPTNSNHILFDLDYCCNITTIMNQVNKFALTNYIITLSLRDRYGNNIKDRFTQCMNLKKGDESINYYRYFDTSAMISITNIN